MRVNYPTQLIVVRQPNETPSGIPNERIMGTIGLKPPIMIWHISLLYHTTDFVSIFHGSDVDIESATYYKMCN